MIMIKTKKNKILEWISFNYLKQSEKGKDKRIIVACVGKEKWKMRIYDNETTKPEVIEKI